MADQSAGGRVALVGAGPAGLVSSRWLLQYGLRPTLFEVGPEMGGLWREKGGVAWPSMTTNISRQMTHVFGLELRSTRFFPTIAEVREYLREYAERIRATYKARASGDTHDASSGPQMESPLPQPERRPRRRGGVRLPCGHLRLVHRTTRSSVFRARAGGLS